MKQEPNKEKDYFRRYMQYFFNWWSYRRTYLSVHNDIQELEQFIFPHADDDKLELVWDVSYTQSLIDWRNSYSRWRLYDLLELLRSLLYDIVIRWSWFVGVKYSTDKGRTSISSMDVLDPNTISVKSKNHIKQSYSRIWYLISPAIKDRSTSINENNIWWTVWKTIKFDFRIIQSLNILKSEYANYMHNRSLLNMNDEHYLPFEKTRYIPEPIKKEHNTIYDLKQRKEFKLPAINYIIWDNDHITSYYEVYTLVRAKCDANEIRNVLIDDFNRILEYVNIQNKKPWGAKLQSSFFTNEKINKVFNLYKEGKIDRLTAVNVLLFEDTGRLTNQWIAL